MPQQPPPDHLLNSHSVEYVESLLRDFLEDPARVAPQWHPLFEGVNGTATGFGQPSFVPSSIFNPPKGDAASPRQAHEAQRFQQRADAFVDAYRCRGHLAARLDPLELADHAQWKPRLETYGLSDADENRPVVMTDDGGNEHVETLGALTARLSDAYCGLIGYEYMHIDDRQMREWMRSRIEDPGHTSSFGRQTQLRILERLTDAVIFEQFVRKKYVGSKTFSLEGAETLIPLLDLALEAASRQGIQEVVMGMAHRGRLNVLANIVGKSPTDIFREFEDQHPDWWRGRGDVKYHLGASGQWQADGGPPVHVSLCFNPSHLEYINAVALGRLRAKQDRSGDRQRRRGLTILIHGDAGFAGEGVVQESLNMCALDGYRTGGTLHVIVNNQLGFTTSPAEGRSTPYASDIARFLQIPIFHVNGEQPLAVARVVALAMEFRAAFARDVVIDMYCFRRWGHNEADEPSFTQPMMYQAIEHRPSIRDKYLEHLLELDQVAQEEADAIANEHWQLLKERFEEAQQPLSHPPEAPQGEIWEPYCGGSEPDDEVDTKVAANTLTALLDKLSTTPQGFHLHKKLHRSHQRRQQMARGEVPLDWSAAEALALASLAVEGFPVRLSGQDSVRGTFSQRHAVLFDAVDGHPLDIFADLSPDQARVEVINSPLAEIGPMGFEYGYSLDYPEALVLWEAQYGDFVNAAQVIIDQFLVSAEDKWRRLTGLVLLLPHGFEGQGPEHSSARLERFLNLAAEDNVQIVVPSTPAQYFHVLRRQVTRRWRKPLVIMTPKSLLRHPRVVSPLEELTAGRFQRILADQRSDPQATDCILLTSGKLYYELEDYRASHECHNFAILRIEQLYPLNNDLLSESLAPYGKKTPVRWVQEEPENMGAAPYWKNRFGQRLLNRHPLTLVTRPPSASPATGSSAAHRAEQQELIELAFEL